MGSFVPSSRDGMFWQDPIIIAISMKFLYLGSMKKGIQARRDLNYQQT